MPLPVATQMGGGLRRYVDLRSGNAHAVLLGRRDGVEMARGTKNGFFGRVVGGQDVYDIRLVGDQ